ncbi:MAG: hypothetical protein HN348_07650 [Proteobacteria bacterium]|jgi:hypothetical protein|nr:hypothetical protein [Pseudomonadota bacterium]
MSFDLDKIEVELAVASAVSPCDPDLAVAMVNDGLRLADRAPVDDQIWAGLMEEPGPLWAEQLGMLARFLATSDELRLQTVEAWRDDGRQSTAEYAVVGFKKKIAPLTAEMIRANAFRREEFLRRWAECCNASIKGEKRAASRKRVSKLDYRSALREFRRAEKQREKEELNRQDLLRKAAEERARQSEARGWRE